MEWGSQAQSVKLRAVDAPRSIWKMCHCFLGLPGLRLRLVDEAVITQLANEVNGFNSHQLPESGPSSGELESLEGSSCFTSPPTYHPLTHQPTIPSALIATEIHPDWKRCSIISMCHLCGRRGFLRKFPFLFIFFPHIKMSHNISISTLGNLIFFNRESPNFM